MAKNLQKFESQFENLTTQISTLPLFTFGPPLHTKSQIPLCHYKHFLTMQRESYLLLQIHTRIIYRVI